MKKINKYFLITRKIPTYLKYYLSKLGETKFLSIVKGAMQIILEKAVGGNLEELKAFGKCEQRLPDGYTELQYLESTGSQYLELGVNDSNSNLEIETTFSDIGGSGYRYIIGCWSKDYDQNTVIYINSNDQIGAWVCHAYTQTAMVTADISKKHTVKVNKDEYYLDGNLVASTFASGAERTGAELYAFKRNGADGTSPQTTSINGKIYNISFKDNGVLIRNYIPARRNSDNVLGMYDTVTNTFFTNAGTGTFTAGPEAVPTPDNPIPIWCNNGELKVRHQSGLPLGYQPYEYITADGNQWLDTGIKLASTDIVEVEFKNSSSTGFGALYGVYSIGESSAFYANGTYYGYDVTNAKVDTGISVDTTWHTLRHDFVNGTITLDGNDTTYTPFEFENIIDNYLFARYYNNNYGYGFKGSCKRYKVIRNGVLICDLIPVVQLSDNAIGMFDLVNNVFCGNIGSDDFTISNQINDLEIYADGTQETIEVDTTGNTATCENLLSVGDYEDIQEVISGDVTRKVGVKVLDGSESWTFGNGCFVIEFANKTGKNIALCTHFIYSEGSTSSIANGEFGSNTTTNIYFKYTSISSVNEWKQYLAQQYANGTPVIIVYPLAQEVQETVTPQSMTLQKGTNTTEVTESSLDDLEIEATYYRT